MYQDKIALAMRAVIFTFAIVGCAVSSLSLVLGIVPLFFGFASFLIFTVCGLVAMSGV